MALIAPVVSTDKRWQPFAFEQITCNAAAQQLTAATYNPSTHATDGNAQAALISFEDSVLTDLLRYRLDGTNPTAAIGNIVVVNDSLYLVGFVLIKQLRFLAPATGKINVTYLR